MSFSGADAVALERLSAGLKANGEFVRQLNGRSTGAIGQSPSFWFGNDAEQFRNQWTTVHSPVLKQVASSLLDLAEMVDRNREDQIETSASLGGPSGPSGGGPAGPGPSGGGPGGSSDSGSFSYGSHGADGYIVDPDDTDWGVGFSTAGQYEYTYVPGYGLVASGDARFEGGFNAQAYIDGQYGHARAEGFFGTRGEASGVFEMSSDRFLLDANAEVFSGAEINGDASLEGYGASVDVEGEAAIGGFANGGILSGFDGRTVHSGFSGEAFIGAKAGAEGDITLFDDDISVGAGVGASTGLGGNISGEGAFGLDEVGLELDLGVAVGLGFDLSVDVSFSPSGLWDRGSDLVEDIWPW